MKKRISLLLLAGLTCITLTGCAVTEKIPFLNKDKGDSVDSTADGFDGSDMEPASDVYILSDLTYNVGDSVTVDDLVDMSDERSIGMVSYSISDGTDTYDMLTFDEPGSFSYVVSIEFDDGSMFEDIATINVLGDGEETPVSNGDVADNSSTGSSEIPDDIIRNIQSNSWSANWVPTADESYNLIDSDIIFSTNQNMIEMQKPITIFPSEHIEMNFSSSSWNVQYTPEVAYMDYAMEEKLSGEGYSLFDTDVATLFTLNFAKSFIEGMVGLGAEWTEAETGEPADMSSIQTYFNMFDYMHRLVEDVVIVSTDPTGYYLYDTSGNKYPLNAVRYQWDLSRLGSEDTAAPYTSYCFIEYNGGYLIISMPSNNVSASASDTEDMADEMPEEALESYEAFIQYISENTDMLSPYMSEDTYTADDAILAISQNSIIGNFAEAVSSGEQSDQQYTPVDEEGSISIDGTPESSDTGDKVLTGAIGNVLTTYEKQHPDLFSWWKDIQKNIEVYYRRWVYPSTGDFIDSDLQYVGSIIPKDGSSLQEHGNGVVDMSGFQDWLNNSNNNNDDSNNGNSSGQSSSDGSTYILSSSYGDYIISNRLHQNVKFNTGQSNSSRLVMTLDNEKYYIETVRQSQINNMITECIYPTNNFRDGTYSITEGMGQQVITTLLGKITPYYITYTDFDGNTVIKPYMAIYNIEGDYLVIYGDNLPEDNDETFVMLLDGMVQLDEG